MVFSVREAALDDVVTLMPLWDEIQGDVPGLTVAALIGRIELSLSDVGFKLLVAWDGDTPVGLLCVGLTDVGVWTEVPGVQVSGLHVRAASRPRGVARALLEAAINCADKWGCISVVAAVSPGDREANRFFARLGFGQTATHRMVDVSSLRRRVSAAPRTVVMARMRNRGTVPEVSVRHALGK
jgi:GNAT superfamily N-acetyltransferase